MLYLLPRQRGSQQARVTHEPFCGICEAPLVWRAGGWRCIGCRNTPSTEALAAWAAEHVGARSSESPSGALLTAADFHAAANAGVLPQPVRGHRAALRTDGLAVRVGRIEPGVLDPPVFTK